VTWAADGAGAAPAAHGGVQVAGGPSTGGPSTGGPAEAAAYGRSLLASLRWPAGTQAADLPPDQVPQAVRDDWWTSPQLVNTGQLLRSPQSVAAVGTYLRSHLPSSLKAFATGTLGSPGAAQVDTVYIAPLATPADFQSAAIVVLVDPWHGGTALIGAYAHVVWFPARSAAERLTAADYQRVVVTASEYDPRLREASRTFRSAAVISRLVSYLNSLHAAPDVPMGCPASIVSYQLTFVSTYGPDAVVSPGVCSTDGIAIGGRQQPALWDGTNRLEAMTVALVGTLNP
jgi:hypothetical protein